MDVSLLRIKSAGVSTTDTHTHTCTVTEQQSETTLVVGCLVCCEHHSLAAEVPVVGGTIPQEQ